MVLLKMSTSYERGKGRGRGIFLDGARTNYKTENHRLSPSEENKLNVNKQTYSLSNLIIIEMDLDQETDIWFAEFKKMWNLCTYISGFHFW